MFLVLQALFLQYRDRNLWKNPWKGNFILCTYYSILKSPGVQMPQHNSTENTNQSAFSKLINAQMIEMSTEPGSDGVTPSTWRTHCAHKLQSKNYYKHDFLVGKSKPECLSASWEPLPSGRTTYRGRTIV